jgi:hypothetical protein
MKERKEESYEKKKITHEAAMNELPLYNHHLDGELLFIFLKRETQWIAAFKTKRNIQRTVDGSNCNSVKQCMKQKSRIKENMKSWVCSFNEILASKNSFLRTAEGKWVQSSCFILLFL